MREILFRGKRIDTKEWVKGSYIYAHKWNWDGSAGHLICDIYGVNKTQVISETLGQFTGLTDKNGKKIFEGDIVRQDNGIAQVIEWISWDYEDTEDNVMIGTFMCKDKNGEWTYISKRDEVIGNIYDNPELLGEQQ